VSAGPPGAGADPCCAVQCFGTRFAIAVARVAENGADHPELARAWLHGAEHARFARFAVERARADFLAGRVAAKTAARALVADAPAANRWEVAPGPQQRPLLDPHFGARAVTLAHAGGIGVAIAHDRALRCGIDIERGDRNAAEVVASQVTAMEANWARSGRTEDERSTRWMLLWTAREALGKSLGTGLLEPERLKATDGWHEMKPGRRAEVPEDAGVFIRAVHVGDFVISLVVPSGFDAEPAARWLVQMLG
jgi:phosphopantetheinyl transferase